MSIEENALTPKMKGSDSSLAIYRSMIDIEGHQDKLKPGMLEVDVVAING